MKLSAMLAGLFGRLRREDPDAEPIGRLAAHRPADGARAAYGRILDVAQHHDDARIVNAAAKRERKAAAWSKALAAAPATHRRREVDRSRQWEGSLWRAARRAWGLASAMGGRS